LFFPQRKETYHIRLSSITVVLWTTKISNVKSQVVSKNYDSENNQICGKLNHRSFGENLRETTLPVIF
jgi:hypothetical protein